MVKKMRSSFGSFLGLFAILALAVMMVVSLTGCSSTTDAMAASAGSKNLDLDGYLMLGELEMANSETGTPQGKILIGNASYKSRRVAIPADQKVPNTGNFKSTKRTSLFGTEEEIIEWDFTAASPDEAKTIQEAMMKKTEEAMKVTNE